MGGGMFTQQTQTVPNMKRILKSSFYGLILSVIISIPYNEGASVKAGPFGKCGAIVLGSDEFNCIYHFFRCECTRGEAVPDSAISDFRLR